MGSKDILKMGVVVDSVPQACFLFPLYSLSGGPGTRISTGGVSGLVGFVGRVPRGESEVGVTSSLSRVLWVR